MIGENPLKILYIEHYAGSLSLGMEFRPFYFAREWIKAGHEVRIVAADFSHLRIRNPRAQRDFAIDAVDGVPFQWVHTNAYEGNGLRRALTMFQFCGKLWLRARTVAKQFCPDVVIASSTYPLDTWPARRIARIAGACYIHEAHDLWPLTLTELGGMSRANPFVILLQIAENSAYRHADCVVSLFPNALEHMQKHGLKDANRYIYIPNGVALEDWTSVERSLPEELRLSFERAHKDKKRVICYLGGHALSNALDSLIDAAALMAEEPVEFFLIGKGAEKERLMKRAEGLQNVRFFDPVSKQQVPVALQEADFLYVGAAPCPLYRFGVSLNKVYDYMMAGKPILYGVEAANDEVAEAKCGISLAAGSVQSIVEAIHRLLHMTEAEMSALGENGRRWVMQNRTYDKLARDFEEVMTR